MRCLNRALKQSFRATPRKEYLQVVFSFWSGLVAQSVERCYGIAEVRGSKPLESTTWRHSMVPFLDEVE